MSINPGLIFVVLVVISTLVFGTQAGAKESKVMRSPLACILFLVIMGCVLWAIWGGHMAVLK